VFHVLLKTPFEMAEFRFERYKLPILAKSLQLHNSAVDCAREMFKPSEDTVSLVVCNEKKVKVLGFCGWCHKWGRFRPFWLRSLGPGPQEVSISEDFFWVF